MRNIDFLLFLQQQEQKQSLILQQKQNPVVEQVFLGAKPKQYN